MQPLDNIKVLDFSTLLPGPLASLVLAEAGANVIKVERPVSGEDMRHYQPRWGEESMTFSLLNRGKKSLALDLKDSAQISLLKPLICDADVLLEQFRPGVMARLGLDYETVKQWNPKLIYCSITGYGQTGPKALQAGHDLNYIGDAGMLSLSMGPDDHPTIPPALIADIGAGTYPAIVNILLALIARQRTGQGTHLDIAMTDHLFMLMSWAQGQGTAKGEWPVSGAELLTGGSPRYQVYQTKDKKFLAAAPLEEKFWQNFCRLIELPAETRDSADARQQIAAIKKTISDKPAEHWQNILENQATCCSLVKTLEQALQDNHFNYRHIFEQQLLNNEGDCLPALPVCLVKQFKNQQETVRQAPVLGSHDVFKGFED